MGCPWITPSLGLQVQILLGMNVCLQMLEMCCVVRDSRFTVQWAVSKFWRNGLRMNSEPEQTIKLKNNTSYRSTGIIVSSQFKAKFPYLSHYVRLSFREEFEKSPSFMSVRVCSVCTRYSVETTRLSIFGTIPPQTRCIEPFCSWLSLIALTSYINFTWIVPVPFTL